MKTGYGGLAKRGMWGLSYAYTTVIGLKNLPRKQKQRGGKA
jgi:hypothetical protein